MKIIIVKGNGNCGKTTSLKMLIQRLRNDPRFRLYDKSRNFYKNMTTPNSDLWAKFCYGGIHILITTYGDSAKDVADFIRRKGTDCDIVVCACHPNYKSFFGAWENCDISEKEKNEQLDEAKRCIDNKEFADNLLKELIDIADIKRKELQKIF